MRKKSLNFLLILPQVQPSTGGPEGSVLFCQVCVYKQVLPGCLFAVTGSQFGVAGGWSSLASSRGWVLA